MPSVKVPTSEPCDAHEHAPECVSQAATTGTNAHSLTIPYRSCSRLWALRRSQVRATVAGDEEEEDHEADVVGEKHGCASRSQVNTFVLSLTLGEGSNAEAALRDGSGARITNL